MNKYAVVVKFVNAFAFAPHLENFSKVKQAYNRHGGRDFLCASLEKGNIEHYPAYYKELKKHNCSSIKDYLLYVKYTNVLIRKLLKVGEQNV